MKMEKEAQVTLFIIMGLVILFVISILFIVSSRVDGIKLHQKDDAVGSYIRQCLYMTTESGLVLIGRRGGRLNLPEQSLHMPYADMAYGLYQGKNSMPGLNSIKSDLEGYIEKNIMGCLGDFSNFPQYEITAGSDIQSEITFADDSTFSVLTLPLEIRNADSTDLMDEFTADIPVRFRTVYGQAYRTMDEQEVRPGMVNLTYQGQKDSDLYVLPYDDSFVFVFEDTLSDVTGGPYLFMLGVEKHG